MGIFLDNFLTKPCPDLAGPGALRTPLGRAKFVLFLPFHVHFMVKQPPNPALFGQAELLNRQKMIPQWGKNGIKLGQEEL